ncbi:phosphotransacetylase [Thermanaerovibrio velox DSM 12556]|uniref:Phosphotransacetylase n=1 Tax=Thermanaerovibrio velox DSM 12556 TaxID=926567 RepID=H0UP32_9BACT|nr:phosphate acyltransferase [Thermanaerovibrio velox]EHM10535.1 phosphotransacetylase [Thermanaerovibrio velox DSM 12556]
MLRSYDEVLKRVLEGSPVTLAVAAAEDREVLECVAMAKGMGLCDALLVGDPERIAPLAEEVGLKDFQVIPDPDPVSAALTASEAVRNRRAQVLMKGLVNTSDFMRGVLNPDKGLRTGNLISHLSVFQIPGEERLVFHSDGGINIAPDLDAKRGILANALVALRALGYECPNVAILSANEQVNPKMQSTVDAAALVEEWKSGAFGDCVVEGPIALDVAVSPEAAKHKGIDSKISGEVDLFLMPNIEAGNVAGKSLIYYAKAQMAGLVLGAAAPIVLTSRSETAKGKLYSIAMACLVSQGSANL